MAVPPAGDERGLVEVSRAGGQQGLVLQERLAGHRGQAQCHLGHADEPHLVLAQLFGDRGEEPLAAAVQGGELVLPGPEGVAFVARGVLAGEPGAVEVVDEQAGDEGVGFAPGRADEDDAVGVHRRTDVVGGAGTAEERLQRRGGVEPVDGVGDRRHRVLGEFRERLLPVVAYALRKGREQLLAPVVVRQPGPDLEEGALGFRCTGVDGLVVEQGQGLSGTGEDGAGPGGVVPPVLGGRDSLRHRADDVLRGAEGAAFHRQEIARGDQLVRLGVGEVDLPYPRGDVRVGQVRLRPDPSFAVGVEEPGAVPGVRHGDALHQGGLGLAVAGLAEAEGEEEVLDPGGADPLAAVRVGDGAERHQVLLSGVDGQVRGGGGHESAGAHDAGRAAPHGGRLEEPGDLRDGQPLASAGCELAGVEPAVEVRDVPAGPRAAGLEVVLTGGGGERGDQLVHPGESSLGVPGLGA